MALRQNAPPTQFDITQQTLNQQSQIIASLSRNVSGTRRRPQPPRNLISQPASLGALITWNAPVKSVGIAGWRIYKDNENNLLEEIRDPSRRQAQVRINASSAQAFYVSSFTLQGAESPKMQVIASPSLGEFLVAFNDPGAVNPKIPNDPPEWASEPTGGTGPNLNNQGGSGNLRNQRHWSF